MATAAVLAAHVTALFGVMDEIRLSKHCNN